MNCFHTFKGMQLRATTKLLNKLLCTEAVALSFFRFDSFPKKKVVKGIEFVFTKLVKQLL